MSRSVCSKCGQPVSHKPEKGDNRQRREDGGSDHVECFQPLAPGEVPRPTEAERQEYRVAHRRYQRDARRDAIIKGDRLA